MMFYVLNFSAATLHEYLIQLNDPRGKPAPCRKFSDIYTQPRKKKEIEDIFFSLPLLDLGSSVSSSVSHYTFSWFTWGLYVYALTRRLTLIFEVDVKKKQRLKLYMLTLSYIGIEVARNILLIIIYSKVYTWKSC